MKTSGIWDPQSYGAFEQERLQPSLDLAQRMAGRPFHAILDVACGSGMSTAPLVQLWPQASIKAVDLSDSMLDKAKERLPQVQFINRDGTRPFTDMGTFDLIFSSGFAPWIDDQMTFFAQTFDALRPGGVSAHQIPLFQEMPASSCIWEALRSMKLEHAAVGLTHFDFSAREYYDIFKRYTDRITCWVTDYYYLMDSYDQLLSFLRGGSLRPYYKIVHEEQKERFETLVMNGMKRCYLPQEDGTILYPFKRFFIIAEKASEES